MTAPMDNTSPVKRALAALEKMQAKLASVEQARTEPIAIIGMSCRFPGGANDPESFWRLLHDGVDAIRLAPPERWDPAEVARLQAAGLGAACWGGFLDGVDQFDPAFFGLSGKEAAGMDPQQRLLLEVGWEALERAGLAPGELSGTAAGVFVGICSSEYAWNHLAGGQEVDAYATTGTAYSLTANRLSYLLNLRGPSMAIDTACSSSLVAAHLACQSLRAGECRIALVGGVNLTLFPQGSTALAKWGMLAGDGRCKTFDARADGYVRGEGCGVVVLKRLSDAQSSGDPILAVIRGSAVNQDGRSAGLTAPNLLAQQAVLRQALANARVAPERIGYVEAHGTGTALGDPIEVESLTSVMGKPGENRLPCFLGSVKTNIGHLEAAAGMAGMIKVVLSLQHNEIPPHLHFRDVNPNISLESSPFRVPTQPVAWPHGAEPRCAGISSFGFGGTNSHIIVEEAPAVAPLPAASVERPLHILALSAKSPAALDEIQSRYAQLRSASWPDVCFTANTGRDHFAERVALIAPSGEAQPVIVRGSAETRPQVAFLFTGQGSQHAGMARQLYETQPGFRATLDRCAEILKPLECPLLDVLADAARLEQTRYAQPALFAVEYALAELWRAWGVEPSLLLGHSLGELVAACVAGAFSLEDGLRMVTARGRLMQATPEGAMAAIFASEAQVNSATGNLRDRVAIAALNGPAETVISGEPGAVATLIEHFQSAGVRTRKLASRVAFHSPLMNDVQARFAAEAALAKYAAPRIGLVSNITGQLAAECNAGYWVRQIGSPVRFAAGLDALRAQGVNVLIEIGPKPTLLGIQQQAAPDSSALCLPSLRPGASDWEQMLGSLARFYVAGGHVDWKSFDRNYPRRRVLLPTYPFERHRYWLDVAPRAERPAASEPLPTANAERWLHSIEWRSRPLPELPAAAAPGRWLLLADSSGLAGRLAEQLQAVGQEAVIAPADAPVEAADWSGIVYLGALDEPAAPQHFPAALERSVRTPLLLAQTLAAQKSSATVWCVTRGAQPVGADGAVAAPAQAALWGFAASLATEHPEQSWCCLDLDPAEAADSAVAAIAAILPGLSSENRMALRAGVLHVPRLIRMAEASNATPAGPSTSEELRVTGDGVYLITGGAGAVGVALAQWLVDRGARRIVLASRNAPSSPHLLDELRCAGAEINAISLDVTDEAAVAQALHGLPLRGVIHAAGIVDDALIQSQDWGRVTRVLAPKVVGAWAIERATAGYALDFFVLCSSAAALLGRPGQAAYGAANAFLDALAHVRNARGARTVSIDWGPIAAGMASHVNARVRAEWAAAGVSMLPASSLGAALSKAWRTGRPQVAVLDVDWQRMPAAMPFLAEVAPAVRTPVAKRKGVALEELIRSTVVEVLGLAAGTVLELDRPLGELGVDSLMAVELRNRLAQELGRPLPATLLFDYPTLRALTRHLSGEAAVRTPEISGAPGVAEPIAIVGMGCRFPGGVNSPEQFWRLLRDGVDAIREVPPERWDVAAYYDPDPAAPGKMNTRWGGFLDGVDQFDARFFGISPREAVSMDPQQRMLLEVSWEALEHAGVAPARLSGSLTGVFVGISTNDYAQLNSSIDAYTGTGSALSVSAGRLSYVLGLQGPSMAVDTACSSSLVAVHLACQSLRLGECKLALAGGVNLLLNPEGMVYVSKLGVMASDGRCKTFDARADGYVRSEGCGVVVLKRLSDALRDGDRVIAVVRGSAVNQDGRSSGLTAPNGPAQEVVIRTAMLRAGVKPSEVGYAEAHGTGTALGDPIEMQALASALGEGRNGGHELLVGAVKTNLGHLESAAGIAGLMKVALSLQHREIPPHLHFETPSPHIPWSDLPVRIPAALMPWPAGYNKRVAGVSSFGFSGTNAHVVLEQAQDAVDSSPAGDGGAYLLPLSARTPEALVALVASYRDALNSQELRDVCYTASLKRNHHEERAAIAGATLDEVRQGLQRWLNDRPSRPAAAGLRHKVVFVFPGQGSQWTGMCRKLLEEEPAFRSAIEECEKALAPETGWQLTEVLSRPEPLEDIDVLQPVLFAIEVALAAVWRSWGIEPDAVIGHSMGEVAAAHVAGVLSLADACRIIARRSRLLRGLRGQGAMAQVELNLADAQAAIALHNGRLAVAASNGSRATVLSGEAAAIEEVVAGLERRGVFARRIKVDVASHSPQVDPLRPALMGALAGIAPHEAAVPLYSTVDGDVRDGETFDAQYWADNLREPVLFAAATGKLVAAGHTVFIELSPHPILLPAIEDRLRESRVEGAAIASFRRGEDGRLPMLQALGTLYTLGLPVAWESFYPGGARLAALPTYPWQHQSFWLDGRLAARAPRSPAVAWPGKRLRSPAITGAVFEMPVGLGELPWLDDHRVEGNVVVAGAVHLSLALSAEPAASRLENIEFRELLVLRQEESRNIQTNVTGAGIRLYSGAEEEWKLHASATVQAAASPGVAVDRAAIEARCREAIDGAGFYRKLWDAGYQLGPSFRWIDRIWRGEGEALCRMRAPRREDRIESYRIPAGLLDSCFQLAAVAAEDAARLIDGESILVPAGIAAIELDGSVGGELWCYAAAKASASGEEVTMDAQLFDASGRCVAAIEQFRARRVSRGRIGQTDRAADWLYQLQWRPAAAPAPPEPATWTLLMDRGGIAESVAAHLESRGHICQRSVDLSAEPLKPCRGVLDFRALDETSEPEVDVLHLVQALARTGWRDVPRLFLFTRGAQAVAVGDPISVRQTPLWGLGCTIALEHPELGCTRIDLGAELDVESIARELADDNREDQAALRGRDRYVARMTRAPIRPQTPARLSAAATYLITGGLGGVGRVVARWMVENGARYLVLAGRSADDGDHLNDLRAGGAQVIAAKVDVSKHDDLAALFDRIDREMPPLRGVIHAATVLDDGILLQLNRERFRAVAAAKIDGGWNLHRLTASRELDFFVLFSSLASLMGSPGQGNYASANAFLDGLAHYRRSQGLPALSINWGPWTEVGQAAAESRRGERLALRGLNGVPPELALQALGLLLASQHAQCAVMNFNLRQWREFYPAAAHAPFLAELRKEQSESEQARAPGYYRAAIEAARPEERREILLAHLREQFGCVLHMDAMQIDPAVALGSLGLDSLMGLEIRNRLEASLGLTLSATMAFTYPTLAALTEHLAEKMDLPLESAEAAEASGSDALGQVAERIASLSDEEMEALLIEKLAQKGATQ